MDLIEQLDNLFNPESIALVGLPRGMKTGKLFLMALLDMGYGGRIYPVHPTAEEIDGLTAYPSVTAIPGPVDLAIVLVQNYQAQSVLEECAAKGVKGVVMFTAGFKELGGEEALAREKKLAETARAAGMRLFGPNCMGLYAPKTGLSFFPGLSKVPGPVGLISHSGSLTNIIGRLAESRGVAFSKVVSLGNEADLNSADFLHYLGRDPETKVIGAYLEGIKDGPYFLESLKEASRSKPVILWKVGLTPEGGRAASAHTGAMAGSARIWQGVINQTGAVPVTGWEEWVDALMTFSLITPDSKGRMAVISGPGGLAVSAAEACGREGLTMARLTEESKSKLAEFVPPTGSSLANPIDVSLTASLDLDIYINAAKVAAADPGVDAVVMIGIGLSPEANRHYAESIIKVKNDSGKNFLIVNIPGMDPTLAEQFCRAGLPFYQSAEKAMGMYAKAVGRFRRDDPGT